MNKPVMFESRRMRLAIALFSVPVGILMIAAIILNFPPEKYLYLPCLFNMTTGLHCPGCGSTRAVSSILHGEIALALKNNLLILLWGPYLAYRALQGIRSWIERERAFIWEPPKGAIVGFLILTLAYTILRNLPIESLSALLAPVAH